jgi:hypothetical protein
MKWLRSILRRVWLFWRICSTDVSTSRPAPPLAFCIPVPIWDAGDAAITRQFLDSHTGQKLLMRATAMYGAEAVKACGELYHTEKHAMRAAGFGDCIKWIRSLSSPEMISQVTGAQVATSTDRQEDEADLVGRLSP